MSTMRTQELSQEINNPHRFIINPTDNSELFEYNAIMNVYKKNPNLKYRIIQNTDVVEENNVTTEKQTSATAIVEPIPALLSYIKEKYNTDVTEEIKDYENKINREGNKD